MTSALRCVPPVLCLVCLASAARAEQRASPIRDDAELFRPDTIAKAEQRIDDVRRTYDRNIFVDTIEAAPDHERNLFRFLYTRQVNRLLDEQARKRADEAGGEGIFVVICNNPKDVHVVVRPDDDSAFSAHDAEVLRRSVARKLHDAGPDEALLALVGQVRAALHAHATRGQSTSVVGEIVLAGLLGGGVALWLLLCMVRYKMRAARALFEYEEGAALLGAMFGSPGGLWLYDKLYPPPPPAPEPLTWPPAPEVDTAEKTEAVAPSVEAHPEDAPVSP